MERKRKIYVKVYFNERDFTTIVEQSVRAGKRKGGLQLFTQKPHGFSNEVIANTKGISKFLKMCAQYYIENENERIRKRVELELKKKELEKELNKLGT